MGSRAEEWRKTPPRHSGTPLRAQASEQLGKERSPLAQKLRHKTRQRAFPMGFCGITAMFYMYLALGDDYMSL